MEEAQPCGDVCCSVVLITEDFMLGETVTRNQKIVTQILLLVLYNCPMLGKALPL